jgi:16S rRNA (adenine1518-N6/adenine1519-N6)-dimethyltransferase
MADSRRTLREHGLSPKKSFGQSFLQDGNVIMKIACACVPDDEVERANVVEIGAGTGALTLQLFGRARQVVAIERDRDLVKILRRLFTHPKMHILEDDAQTVDIAGWLVEPPRVLCGNLPYQLTGKLLRRTIELAGTIDRAVFMVQSEVADRLVAEPGSKDYGALTVFTRAAMSVERLFTVRRNSFYPPPAVTSAVVRLVPRNDRIPETEMFRTLVKRAFEMRRKTLRNAWSKVAPRETLERAAKAAGISLDARGETLSVDEFAKMGNQLR